MTETTDKPENLTEEQTEIIVRIVEETKNCTAKWQCTLKDEPISLG